FILPRSARERRDCSCPPAPDRYTAARRLGRRDIMRPRRKGHAWRRGFYLVLGAAALVNSGCLLAAAGVAGGAAVGYAYHEGKLCQTFNACLEDTAAASRTALAELGMPVLKEQTRPGEGFLLSTTADGEKVRVYLDTRPSKFQAEGPSTRVSVRVATFGDPDVSARLLNQVAAHLVAGPVADR